MKKKLILALAILLGCAGFAKADVLANTDYFPDEKFLGWVLNHFNKVRGSRLTDEELASVKSITTFGDPYLGDGVKTLKGVEYFTELEYLSIRNLNEKYGDYGNTIGILDLSKNKKLKTFYFCTTGFYYGNPDIKISNPFDCLYGYFTGETSKTTSTTDASRFMRLKKVNLANLPELKDVDIESQALSELDLRGCPNLRTVIVHDCEKAVDIKLDTCENLETFAYSKCSEGVKLPDFALMPNLRALMCDDGKLTALDLSEAPKNLEVLSCSGNLMTSLDLSNCTKLKSLSCQGLPLDSLDCSQLDSLKYINVTNCEWLRTFPAFPSGIATILCDRVKAFANIAPIQYSNLKCLQARWCSLTKFDASKYPNLLAVDLNRNNIAAPSFSGLYYDEDKAEGYRRFEANAQDIYVIAKPVSGRYGYWRILLPDDVDLNRINSYRFSENFSSNNCELYMEYYEDAQGNLKPSFVTNLKAVGDKNYTRNYLIYYYDTGGTYTYSRYYGTEVQPILTDVCVWSRAATSGVDDVAVDKAVKGVKYFDLQGHESAEPFSGFNIEVTQYTDGTSQSRKLVH